MDRKLRIFVLAAFVFSAMAGVAGADPIGSPNGMTLPATGSDQVNPILVGGSNTIGGEGTFTGSITAVGANLPEALKIQANPGKTITIAPDTNMNIDQAAGNDATPLQFVINPMRGQTGTVIIKGSNREYSTLLPTYYTGGTVLNRGVLAITNHNSLGQRWVAMYSSSAQSSAPIFRMHNVSYVRLGDQGENDPLSTAGRGATAQPFFLLWRFEYDSDRPTTPIRERTAHSLRYAIIDTPSESTSVTEQGLHLMNGLDQRVVATSFVANAGANDTLLDIGDDLNVDGDTFDYNNARDAYVRLVKTGPGRLVINGGSRRLATATADLLFTKAPRSDNYLAVDGAFHRGGTTVEGGTLVVIGGLEASGKDQYRGSLGRTWRRSALIYQGSEHAWNNSLDDTNYNLNAGPDQYDRYYNPLRIKKGEVIVNRSQFFTDFNVDAEGTFRADKYTLSTAAVRLPQITVGLGKNDSSAKGKLKGEFNLVLDSIFHRRADDAAAAAADSSGQVRRPSGDGGTDERITNPGYAFLSIENADNEITEGETLIADGVLEIAGAKSIGPGTVRVASTVVDSWRTGAVLTTGTGIDDGIYGGVLGSSWYVAGDLADDVEVSSLYNRNGTRGFVTNHRGVFAASKSFRLPNTTLVYGRGMLAAEQGTELSFKNVTVNSLATGDNVVINPEKGANLNYFWSGTVTFGPVAGDEGKYYFRGTVRNPSPLRVNHGVWQLNSYPTQTSTQVENNDSPYADVTIDPGATLSLAKDVNNFQKHMNVTVNNDSRIRMVLRDGDIATTRAGAMQKEAVFSANVIDYTDLGYGPGNKDRRIEIQLDPRQLTSGIKAGWMKAIFSPDAINWNALHYLRDESNVKYEDYAKVRVGWVDASDLPADTKNYEGVAHLDENSYTILIEFATDIVNPLETPSTPSTPSTPTTPTTPSTPSTPSTPTTPSTPSTPSTPASPATPDTVETSEGGSSGGCEMGFGALSMALAAAAFLLRKKD